MAFEQHEFSPGEKIGSYKVLRPLGMGAAGTVVEAKFNVSKNYIYKIKSRIEKMAAIIERELGVGL